MIAVLVIEPLGYRTSAPGGPITGPALYAIVKKKYVGFLFSKQILLIYCQLSNMESRLLERERILKTKEFNGTKAVLV